MSIRPSGYSLQHLLHLDRTAGVHDPFVLRQHDAELALIADGMPDHFLVSLFKNMQRKVRPREDHQG